MRAFVVEAEVALDPGSDPAAVGAAVTTGLCGHWDHEGPCRWPHNNAINAEREPAEFRTVFVAEEGEAPAVRKRIETRLLGSPGWRVVSLSSRALKENERSLAETLLTR